MFTGIVQTIGKVISCESGILTIDSQNAWLADPIILGESIATNGICLTVVQSDPHLVFNVSEETLAVTALKTLNPGSRVNLERALRPIDRVGGHFVQGHVDQVGKFLSSTTNESSVTMNFDAGDGAAKYLTPKGSITIEGISLTIVNPEKNTFQVAVIPHTWENTSLSQLQPGQPINIEFDMLAKTIETLLKNQS